MKNLGSKWYLTCLLDVKAEKAQSKINSLRLSALETDEPRTEPSLSPCFGCHWVLCIAWHGQILSLTCTRTVINQGSTFRLLPCLVQLAEAAGLPTCREFSWEVSIEGGNPCGEGWLSVRVCLEALCISEVAFLHLWVLRRLAEEDALFDRCTSRGTKWPMYPMQTVLRLQVSRTHPQVTGYFSPSSTGNSHGRP